MAEAFVKHFSESGACSIESHQIKFHASIPLLDLHSGNTELLFNSKSERIGTLTSLLTSKITRDVTANSN